MRLEVAQLPLRRGRRPFDAGSGQFQVHQRQLRPRDGRQCPPPYSPDPPGDLPGQRCAGPCEGATSFSSSCPARRTRPWSRRKADEVCRALAARSGTGAALPLHLQRGRRLLPPERTELCRPLPGRRRGHVPRQAGGKGRLLHYGRENGPPPCANDPLPKGPRAQ